MIDTGFPHSEYAASISWRGGCTRSPRAINNLPSETNRAYVPVGTRSRFSCAVTDGIPGASAIASHRPFCHIATAADHARPAPRSIASIGRPSRVWNIARRNQFVIIGREQVRLTFITRGNVQTVRETLPSGGCRRARRLAPPIAFFGNQPTRSQADYTA